MIMPTHSLSIRNQCRLLEVNRSSYYYCPKEAFADSQLINLISEIHNKYPFYGYRKIHWYLTAMESITINSKKVQRLMKEAGIKAIFPGPRTSIPGKDGTIYDYLLKNLVIDRSNQVWAIDITYIKLPVGTVYLFALIDWRSRFIVAHKLVNTMESWHAIEAIEYALEHYGVPEICNADQGSQFTGSLWIDKLNEYQIKISHDGVGRCIDNVRIERFWRTIKYEDIYIQSYDNIVVARAGISNFVKYYNFERPHQRLGYKTPSAIYFEKKSQDLDKGLTPRGQAASPQDI
jgi:putative transposase